VVIGGAYNSGILATGPKPGAFFNYDPAPPEILDRVAKIEAICKKHGVKLVQAALRFPLVHPVVACVIPGAARAGEIALNMDTLAATIPAALWADLKAAGLMRADAPVPA
jgi:D-threo-aldose 1-dehydrogenase